MPLIAAETTKVPGQRLMKVMPRSWQFEPLYVFFFFFLSTSGMLLVETTKIIKCHISLNPSDAILKKHEVCEETGCLCHDSVL